MRYPAGPVARCARRRSLRSCCRRCSRPRRRRSSGRRRHRCRRSRCSRNASVVGRSFPIDLDARSSWPRPRSGRALVPIVLPRISRPVTGEVSSTKIPWAPVAGDHVARPRGWRRRCRGCRHPRWRCPARRWRGRAVPERVGADAVVPHAGGSARDLHATAAVARDHVAAIRAGRPDDVIGPDAHPDGAVADHGGPGGVGAHVVVDVALPVVTEAIPTFTPEMTLRSHRAGATDGVVVGAALVTRIPVEELSMGRASSWFAGLRSPRRSPSPC